MRPALPCEKTGRQARNTPTATANTRIHAPVFERRNFIPTPSYDRSSLGLSQFQVSGPTLFQGFETPHPRMDMESVYHREIRSVKFNSCNSVNVCTGERKVKGITDRHAAMA